ncbi:hypothetical protein ACLB2K_071154 [Fragaria x ananassa]
MVNNREKQLEVDEVFCNTCRATFNNNNEYDKHFPKKKECIAIRDAAYGQYDKQGPLSLEKRQRVLRKQLQKVEKNEEEGEGGGKKKKRGNQGKKKKGNQGKKNQGRKGKKNKKK